MFGFFKKKKEPKWAKYLAQAESSFRESRYSEVIKLAEKVVNILESNEENRDGDLSWAYFLWGRASMDSGDYSIAYKKLGRSGKLANKLDPEEFMDKRMSISFAMAELLFRRKEYTSAKNAFSSFESAISKDPTPDVLHMKVYIYLAHENYGFSRGRNLLASSKKN